MDPNTFNKVMEDLRSHDITIRTTTFGRLAEVADTIGPERVRNELLPYLNEFIDDEDSVLLELCHQLTHLMDRVGGSAYLHCMLEILETLVCCEDATVRTQAQDVLLAVIARMSDEDVVRHVLPVLRHLTCSEWHTSRVSACALLPVAYQRVTDPLQKELRSIFASLCVDEIPTVRRAACFEFAAVAACLSDELVLQELAGPFLRLAKDDQDSVRLLSVDACIAMLPAFARSGATHRILPSIFALCTDKSWRVRYMIADRFPVMLAAIGADMVSGDELADFFQKLLTDHESEIRTAAAAQLYPTCEILGADRTLRCLMRAVKQLAQDPCQHTRAALGKEIMFLALVLPPADFLTHILPLFLTMLKDQHAEVRLNLISRLEFVQSVVGEDTLAQALLPAICQLALDSQWRTRLAIIEHVPKLAWQLGRRFFESKLVELTMSWVGDTVASVREAAGNNFPTLCQIFGSEWAVEVLVPRVDHLSTRKSCPYRLTALFILRDLWRVMRLDLACKHLAPLLLRLAQDAVPNVRFTSIKAMRVALGRIACKPLPPRQSPNDVIMSGKGGDEEPTASRNSTARSVSKVRPKLETRTARDKPLEDVEGATREATDRQLSTTSEVMAAHSSLLKQLKVLVEDSDRDVSYSAAIVMELYRDGMDEEQ